MTEEKRKMVNVTHIMANGEVRDSLDGYEININSIPDSAKRIIKQLMLKNNNLSKD